MSAFRKVYRELSDAEKEHIEKIKDAAQALELLINDQRARSADDNISYNQRQRHITLAMTNLEQAVMWAVKAHS